MTPHNRSMDRSAGLRCDQTIVLTGVDTAADYPQPLRRIKYHDEQIAKTCNFPTNNFAIPAQTVADLRIGEQVSPLIILAAFPGLNTWLPKVILG